MLQNDINQENANDIKALKLINKLYTELLFENMDYINNNNSEHELSLFMVWLVFCFFSENVEIFSYKIFTKTVTTLSISDGSNLSDILNYIYERTANNKIQKKLDNFPKWVFNFPYIKIELFNRKIRIPRFSSKTLQILKDCGNLDWRKVNSVIFGSLIQITTDKKLRRNSSIHYTSISNINKLLNSILFDKLDMELNEAGNDIIKLKEFHNRLSHIRIFDPACGSGNFLIVAYHKLKELEFEVLKRLKQKTDYPLDTSIHLYNFYGIELSNFATQVAHLSLLITKYQMNIKMKEILGISPIIFPLIENEYIICGNALRLDWKDICLVKDIDPKTEIYIVGNPPFVGHSFQRKEQKEDLALVFSSYTKNYKMLDYSAGWFFKISQFLTNKNVYRGALISTNSICQGKSVELLWSLIFKNNIEIGFAYPSFKWKNNIINNAEVICIIVGLQRKSQNMKTLYFKDYSKEVYNISPYLLPINNNIIVQKRSKPLGKVPIMIFGNKPTDGGHLMLSTQEKKELLTQYPQTAPLVKRIYGSQEFIRGEERFCLWIHDQDLPLAQSISPIMERFEKVKQSRLASPKQATHELARIPHRFEFINEQTVQSHAFLIPRVSSEQRRYLSIGFMPADVIISDRNFIIFDPPDYLFAILSSRLHAVWLANIGGRLGMSYSYSNTIVYNTFPFLPLTSDQEEQLAECAGNILAAREEHPGKTIATLYNPQTMPANLLQAHHKTDILLETFYNGKPFINDEERLDFLFEKYEKLLKENI